MKRLFILSILIITNLWISTFSYGQLAIRWHNEATDTTKITNLLIEASAQQLSEGETILWLAEKFVGSPYVAGTLEGDEEMLSINIDEFDCFTLVETVAAMAMTVNERRTSWRDFAYNLQQLRYRGGEVDGYGSRLHYFSDWVVDNTHRGNVREVTDRIYSSAHHMEKSIDFMSSNADKYPALSDADALNAIKNAEIGYRRHRFPIIKTRNITSAPLSNGDIVAITTSIKGLDVTHTGIIKVINGTAHLVHASSKAGKVIIDDTTLANYVRYNRTSTGIRVVRLTR